jgi:asparagine synthetase B (glutamine-hydrolysing)
MDTTHLGDLTVFGFTQDPDGFVKHRLPARLGITPRTIDFGTAGHFFFHTSLGDVAESEEAIALKLGFVRSPTMSPLSAQQLLAQKTVQSHSIDHSAFRGNALVACFSKIKPCFSVYQTILAPLPLYYTCLDKGILCATDPRCLLALLEGVELNEDVIPMHFLFAFPVGPLTYFRDIWRLCPGQKLEWSDNHLDISLVEDLRLPGDEQTFDRLNSVSIEALYERMSGMMQVYMTELEKAGHRPGNLLSGGVDSSVLQLLINEQLPQSEPPRSFGYLVEADSFEFEIEYARHASELFQTQHTFVHISPQGFPDLLNRTVETLGQPNLCTEAATGKMALAEFLASNVPDVRYFFSGAGADGLHGMGEVKKMALFETARRIPGSRLAFQLMGTLLARWSGTKAHGLQEVAKMLAWANNPTSSADLTIYLPTNYVSITGGVEMPRRCFGDQALLKAFDYRRDLEVEYLNGASVMEKAQVIDLLTLSYETAVVLGQLFFAYRKRPISFYLDQDVVRMTMAFSPKVRFLKGWNTKPLQKQILTRKSLSVLARKKKGGSVFTQDLYDWMERGPLQEMVQAIDVPDFMNKADFDEIVKHPGPFLWRLLIFDIFKKRVLKRFDSGSRMSD